MMELAHQDFLFTSAEVAAAFVGFSLVVSMFKQEASPGAVRVGSLRDVAEIGLILIGGSLAPYALNSFSLEASAVWRAASLLLVVSFAVFSAFAYRRFSKLGGPSPWRTSPLLLALTGLPSLAGNVALWWNVFAPSTASEARYLLAILLFLGWAGVVFVFAAFRENSTPAA